MKNLFLVFLSLIFSFPVFGNGDPDLNTAKHETYLSYREKQMIKELNTLRFNPEKYIVLLENHIENLEKKNAKIDGGSNFLKGEIQASREALRTLVEMDDCQLLKPDVKLYNVANLHGQDMRNHNYFGHQGKDGRSAQERVEKATSDVLASAEVLGYGNYDLETTVLQWLIDVDDMQRENRKNLLRPQWNYISCSEAGYVDGRQYTWVVLFGEREEERPEEYEEETVSTGETQKPRKIIKNPYPKNVKGLDTGKGQNYLTTREKEMIKEINTVRDNPAGYVPYIDEFIEKLKAKRISGGNEFAEKQISIAEELKKELTEMEPVPVLLPHKAVYYAASRHADDLKSGDASGHLGSDGTYPWDRIMEEDETLTEGDENIVEGYMTVRGALIHLLIDAGTGHRGHRKTILGADWQYIGVREIPKAGSLNHLWVQNFAHAHKKKNFLTGYEVPKKKKKTVLPKQEKETSKSSRWDNYLNNKNNNISNSKKENTITETAPTLNSDIGQTSYLTDREKDMIAEINLLRSDPPGYIPKVEAYLQGIEEKKKQGWNGGGFFDEQIKVGRELIRELRSTKPLSILKPHKGVYTAARLHGIEERERKKTGHVGNDGSYPTERILRQAPDLKEGGENLVGGPEDIKESLMLLLIDAGISNRGHRKTLLDPKWAYIGCYDVGKVGNMPNCWVQNFASSQASQREANAIRPKPELVISKKKNTKSNNIKHEISTAGKTSSSSAVGQMTSREREMVDEINLLRSNPVGYIPKVEAYMATLESENSKKVARELIAQLRRTSRLSTLAYHDGVYEAAKKHGQEEKARGKTGHVGNDGSYPWDRILREATDLNEGGENLVGGPVEIERAIMLLLVDEGIPNRGHRNTLLNPKWKYVACYEVGTVGQMPNCWVQNFGH